MNYVGLVVFLILLWIRPEYRFLLFYVVANTVLLLLLTVWSIRSDQLAGYLSFLAVNDALLLAIGAPVVALRKWLRGGDDRRAERLVAEARAEAAQRSK